MKILMDQLLYSVIFILITLNAFPQAGTLDTGFGSNGIVQYDYGDNANDIATDIHIYSDTSIIVCGYHSIYLQGTTAILQKFNKYGGVDNSWGTNSVLTFQNASSTLAENMFVQSDGKIIVSGSVYDTANDAEFFVSRFNPDGSFDTSFNGTGTWISSYSSENENCEAMAVQADGKIVLAGTTFLGTNSEMLFARLNSDGTLDTAFGTGGFTMIVASVQYDKINGIDILSNGAIIGTGHGFDMSLNGNVLYLAKLESDGDPWPGFGTNGAMIPSVITNYSAGYDCVVANDSILVIGKMDDTWGDDNILLAKFDADGNAASNFGSGGINMFSMGTYSVGFSLIYGSDNAIYACGTTGTVGANPRQFIVLRYTGNGVLDPLFNSNGYTVTNIGSSWDEANALAMAPDGKIVLAGYTSGFTSTGHDDRVLTRYYNDFQPMIPDFTVDDDMICEGSTVNYTDLTIGAVTGWEWTFDGGTPATSTQQNPVVTYNTAGTYDVKMVVSNGVSQDSVIKTDYMEVLIVAGQPAVPGGDTALCGSNSTEYTTGSVLYATTYEWIVDPAAAGSISGSDTVGTFESSDTWTGTYTVKVRGLNDCGAGSWSPGLACELYLNPAIYALIGDGAYCAGGPGAELMLDSSQAGVDYELYKDAAATGNIVAGTGYSISFGYITDEGLYTASGYTANCYEDMIGQIFVHEVLPPQQPSTPAGPEQVCNNDSSFYTTEPDPDVETYVWALSPEDAGALTPMYDSVNVAWTKGFEGSAYLSVYGTNDCGDGVVSDLLEITVMNSPEPVIDGPEEVCENEEEVYFTPEISGNTYSWEVGGGSITAGTGTHEITVMWGNPGPGWLTVTEEDPDGCSVTTEEYNVVIDECVAIDEYSQRNIRVYPVPSSGNIYFEIENAITSKLTVYTFDGRKHLERSLSKNTTMINLAPGAYFYLLSDTNGNRVASGKLFVYR